MARAFVFRNFAVYVLCERGHHGRPHAHIKAGRHRVASIFLETLEVYDATVPLPKELLKRIRDGQEALVALWIALNEDD